MRKESKNTYPTSNNGKYPKTMKRFPKKDSAKVKPAKTAK